MKPTEEIQKQIERLAEEKFRLIENCLSEEYTEEYNRQIRYSRELYKQGMTDLWERLGIDEQKLITAFSNYAIEKIGIEEAKQQIINALKIQE